MQARLSSSSAEQDADSGHARGPSQEWNYSEGISISRVGPSRNCIYGSRLILDGGQNFKETAVFEQRLQPYFYGTSVIVDMPFGQDPPQFVETVAFKPRWVSRLFAETVFSYHPRESKRRYVTTLVYDPDSVQCRYVTGLRICAPINCVDLGRVGDCKLDLRLDPETPTDDRDGPKSVDRTPFSPSPQDTKVSKSRQWQRDILERCEQNGFGGTQHSLKKGLDENCNLFNNTKEISIN